jgi:hypothetical protein
MQRDMDSMMDDLMGENWFAEVEARRALDNDAEDEIEEEDVEEDFTPAEIAAIEARAAELDAILYGEAFMKEAA